MFSIEQRDAVSVAFRRAGYDGPLKVAPVISEDERVFLLLPEALASLRDKAGLERVLQQVLGRKIWVAAQTERWADPFPFD